MWEGFRSWQGHLASTLDLRLAVSGPYQILERGSLVVPPWRQGDEAGLLGARGENGDLGQGARVPSCSLPSRTRPKPVTHILRGITTPWARLVIAPPTAGARLLREDRASEDCAEDTLVPRFQSALENRNSSFAVEGPRDREVLANLHSVPRSPAGRFTDFVSQDLPRRDQRGERTPISFPRVPRSRPNIEVPEGAYQQRDRTTWPGCLAGATPERLNCWPVGRVFEEEPAKGLRPQVRNGLKRVESVPWCQQS